jgi:hypothetical protein
VKGLSMGQYKLAKQAHVNIETIRYYERRGLMPQPPRLESGYRQLPPVSSRCYKASPIHQASPGTGVLSERDW